MQNLISELKRASKALWVWKEHVYYDNFFFNPVLGLSAAWAVTSKNYIMKEKKKKKKHAFNQKSNVFLTLKSGSRF